ncbi:hypothetical protein NHP190012_11820 [Helicobacter sp. NHP19-012]|uniref:Transposase n=1 Tax=Helicobacter gastrofelis TaxID=2849642 RepID=A0ABN6ID09_9HELI|nr:hypothetical protein NHP190012_11820 [Helicobacter sp. NHP19-012]
MQKVLITLKKQEPYAYLGECNSQSLQMVLRQLTTAFDRFFSKLAKNHKLAKSIVNASWSRLISLLTYKANWKGKTLLKIDQYFRSNP